MMDIRWIEANGELGLIIPLSLAFGSMLIIKLLGKMKEDFQRWGFPVWMPYVVALYEAAGVWYLWQRDWQILAAMCLAVIPFGAIITMTRYYEAGWRYWLPGATLAALVGVILIR